jgi:hypothetical protein
MDDVTDRPRTHCPQCGAILEFTLRFHGVTVLGQQAERPPSAPQARQGTAAEQDVLAAARRAGLLEPFIQTVRYVKRDQVPNDLEAFFLAFVRGLTQRLIPGYAMEAFSRLFHHRPIEYHTAQGIGVVIVDGYMRLFVPNTSVVGTKMRSLNNQSSSSVKRTLKIDDGKEKLREWLHTKWGYVASEGALYEHLRTRSFGEFARPNLSAPSPHTT